MNQILSVEMPNNKNRKSNKKASIKSVVIFFCIILLIFGIAMIAVGMMSNKKTETETKQSSTPTSTESKPNIEIVQGTTSLDVTVSSSEQIENIKYKWNNEDETQVNGNGETTLNLTIKIPIGTNILSIVATDVNGGEQTFEKEYIGVEQYEPTITLEQETNTIKVKCSSEKTIDYISYHLDDEEETVEQINDVTAEVSIDITDGEHTLTVTVVNQDGEKYEETKPLYIPTASVVTDGTDFIINASDTRGITKISINFNGEEQEIEVNDTNYENRLTLQDGENKIILVVYNSDGLSITKRVRYTK
jgi:hypothetical protein